MIRTLKILRRSGVAAAVSVIAASGVWGVAFAQDRTSSISSFPETMEKQAAYCMEASFGYFHRQSRLLAVLQETKTRGQALLSEGAKLSDIERTEIGERIKSLQANIEASEREKAAWDGHLKIFLDYMQAHKLLDDRSLVQSMSGQVGDEQRAVQDFYQTCTRACAANGADSYPCRKACNDKAEASDASRRMYHCSEISDKFK